MHKRYYIGMTTSPHDPAIAILDENGKVFFAEAAERRYQVKKAVGCPPDNFAWAEELIERYCTSQAEYVITKSWSDQHMHRASRFSFYNYLKDHFTAPSAHSSLRTFNLQNYRAMIMNAGANFERIIRNRLTPANIKTIAYDHHLSHAGLACYGSPFNEAICLVADGEGEEGSISIYRYENAKIHLLEKQAGFESLGNFYGGLTFLCGMDPLMGEEWKVMGLAPHGSFNERLYQLFRSVYNVDGCRLIKGSSNLLKVAGIIQEHTSTDPNGLSLKADIAYNGHLVYTQWMNELITNIHKKYPSDNLILTGGCALNSSQNGEILDKTLFKGLYVPPAPADDGNALGGALLAYYTDHPHTESIHKNISPYLGTEINEDHLQHFLKFSKLNKIRKLTVDKYDTVAKLLAEGKIIGWVQSKAEFGPRALGNRSILADPRRKEIKDIINDRVKFREEFRPFAPSILHEYGDEYFEHYQESHYMERTLKFKKQVISKVPGVVHKDGTGRLQSVKEEWNPELYHLLKAFHKITGVPVLLNTSFNIMGKPIIHRIEDAISTFFTTGLDALIINDHLIEK